jgi:replicative DNA helicase
MHADDIDALYAMLQKTAEDQPDKVMIGASTPTGRRERFWEWCRSPRFTEFWFPSYCNPYFSKEQEEEFREQYSPSGYRHEIEADWGEDSEGVYPRKFVDRAFISPSWDYTPEITSARSFHTIGVDWDKYGAGTNIVIVETCAENYEDTRFRGKSRICYREEIPRSEYTLTKAVDRIIELNRAFNPKHIYVDRGYGEVND